MLIPRSRYLTKIIDYMWDGQVKVITGIRRCGKSVLLFDLFYDYLLNQGVKKENIIKIKLDLIQDSKYRNPLVLTEYLDGIVKKSKEQYYAFIDEVQYCHEVEDPYNKGFKLNIYDLLNSLKSYPNLDLYVTGSNSKMLSKDIETQFRGRASKIHVWPLSFEEYHTFSQKNLIEDFKQYMIYGGMPYLTNCKNNTQKKDYLHSLFKEVYIKDIKERCKIEKINILEMILNYLSSVVGSLTNPNNIAKALKENENIKTTNHTVESYLNHIIDSFLIEQTQRYDIKRKKYFDYPNKYYFCDVGLRNARLNFRQQDLGYLMENIIYNELRMRGYSVDVGVVTDRTNGNKLNREIDFIVNYGDKRSYIQSAYEMSSNKKIINESTSLKLTGDFFQKIIIQNDVLEQYTDENGILHCSVLDFLTNDNILFIQ